VRGEAPESRVPEPELSLLILLVGPTWLESPRAFVVSDYIPPPSPVFLLFPPRPGMTCASTLKVFHPGGRDSSAPAALARQSLHLLLMRWCSQMLDPLRSLHLLRRLWCSQMLDSPQCAC